MKYGAATVVMLAAGGCNWVFDLSKTHPLPDAQVIDGQYFDAGPDGPPDAFCTVSTITRAVEADGPIFQTQPNQGLSDLTLINLKGALQDRALFRFDVGGLPPGYVSLTLRLAYAEHDAACGTTCASSCASLEQAGDFDVHPVRSDWTERMGLDIGITWNCRSGPAGCTLGSSQPWTTPGADGADRGPKLGTFTHAPSTSSELKISHANLATTMTWIQGTKLSFEVVPVNVAVGAFVIRAHEHTCDAAAPASQLVVTYCQ